MAIMDYAIILFIMRYILPSTTPPSKKNANNSIDIQRPNHETACKKCSEKNAGPQQICHTCENKQSPSNDGILIWEKRCQKIDCSALIGFPVMFTILSICYAAFYKG